MKESYTLILPAFLYGKLYKHLFPGDGDEHGAVICASICKTENGFRLLARDLFLATDGVDYVPGIRGYKMLHASFIQEKILYCRENQLVYLAIHNHGGNNHVGFSSDDIASHERGYPALLDINKGTPVGALVFARNAVAGDIWLSYENRIELTETRILGVSIKRLYPSPPMWMRNFNQFYDRQILLYGDVGHEILSKSKIGIIGLGGVGALVNQLVARLGVGCIVAIDPERVSISNLPRVVGALRWHALSWLANSKVSWLKRLSEKLSMPKVDIAKNVAKSSNPDIRFKGIFGNALDSDVAKELVDCDFIFLTADSMQSRLLFNSLVYQYLIPGVQIGSKITHDKSSGELLDVFSVVRPVTPNGGCLFCNGLINNSQLQKEAISDYERKTQAYVDDDDVTAPSVITLNAVGAGHAVDDFMLKILGFTDESASTDYVKYFQRKRSVLYEEPRKDVGCRFCGTKETSIIAKGDLIRLPVKLTC